MGCYPSPSEIVIFELLLPLRSIRTILPLAVAAAMVTPSYAAAIATRASTFPSILPAVVLILWWLTTS